MVSSRSGAAARGVCAYALGHTARALSIEVKGGDGVPIFREAFGDSGSNAGGGSRNQSGSLTHLGKLSELGVCF
jgi:hypothetical protein